MFSDIWMLPLSTPVSNSVTALLSTSRAGIANFDLGAKVTSKHITICEDKKSGGNHLGEKYVRLPRAPWNWQNSCGRIESLGGMLGTFSHNPRPVGKTSDRAP